MTFKEWKEKFVHEGVGDQTLRLLGFAYASGGINFATRLISIANIIEAVEERCLAADGAVTQTTDEITPKEISDIYDLATVGQGKTSEPAELSFYYIEVAYAFLDRYKQQGVNPFSEQLELNLAAGIAKLLEEHSRGG